MNYYEARQRSTDGRWDWTCMNDGQIWRAAPCRDHGAGGHATKEEAERHYWEYQTGELRTFPDQAHYPCKVCETFTNQRAISRDGMVSAYLCDEHRNIDIFRALFPFKPGMSIASSW